MTVPNLILPLNGDVNGDGRAGDWTATVSGPLRYHAGKWPATQAALIEEATTNLMDHPQTPVCFAYSNVTVTTLTGQAIPHPSGVTLTQATRVTVSTAQSSSALVGFSIPISGLAAGTVLTVQLLVRASPEFVGKTLSHLVNEGGGASPTATDVNTTVVATGEWQQVVHTITLGQSDRTALYCYFSNVAVADQVIGAYLDVTGVQLETKAYATSYCDGSLGTGYAWTGTAFASTSTRITTYVRYTHLGNLSARHGSLVAWMQLFDTNTRAVASAGGGGTGTFLLCYASADRLRGYIREGAAGFNIAVSPTTLVHGAWTMVYMEWTETTTSVAVNLDALTTVSRASAAPNDDFGDVDYGYVGGYGASYASEQAFGPIAFYDQPLTDAERATLYHAASPWAYGTLLTDQEKDAAIFGLGVFGDITFGVASHLRIGGLARNESPEPFGLTRISNDL